MTRVWEGSNDKVTWTHGVAPDSSNFRYVRSVDEPAKHACGFSCAQCERLDGELRGARAEAKHLEGQVESYSGATIARLERELAEAKRSKPATTVFELAVACLANEHRTGGEFVELECSLVDYLRLGLTGRSTVFRQAYASVEPNGLLREGELRVKP